MSPKILQLNVYFAALILKKLLDPDIGPFFKTKNEKFQQHMAEKLFILRTLNFLIEISGIY